ncbi:MAG: extracellular solute-binding protein [Rickettsiales bacterium]|nr:extracellular solute-binding protein [Rickettsiales bacterium]
MTCAPAYAGASHCLTLWGACKYPANFKHFEYVNPAAPVGGTVKLAETGTFDSLNPFILKGVKAPAIGGLFESLMVQSLDEPQTMYGLIAEAVEVAKDNRSASFVIRPEAKFSDGTKITPDDVVFSFTTLRDKGDPTFKMLYGGIERVEVTGKDKVTFYFIENAGREQPMVAAQMPVLSKAYYEKVDFEKTTLTAPVGSGPYLVESLEQGRSIIYKRNPDYWGWHLPAMRGQYNFARIRYDFYRDENVALEGLKAGEYDFRQEYIARNWATAYDTPAVKDGRIIKRMIEHQIPQGMQAFVFNTRHEKFSDRRVREAIGLTMDYEWQNKTLFYGAYLRNDSYFNNTDFEARDLPQGKELALLDKFKEQLPPFLFTEAFKNWVTDGSGNNRAGLLRAQELLNDAGWKVKDGKRVNDRGEQLSVEFMLRQPTMERVIQPMRKGLDRLGIASSIRMVDDAQYQKRIDSYDFDMVSVWLNRGVFFPGSEQMTLWHSSQADIKGGNNITGIKNPAVDAALAALTSAQTLEDLTAAGRALDRVLLWEYIAIPHWHSPGFRVAYWNKFGLPKVQAKYNLCFQCWWISDGGKRMTDDKK